MGTNIPTLNPTKENKGRIDFSLDYHAHVLPGCDHGSDGLKTSLAQLALAQAAGIRTLCATSHFYPHRESMESFLARRQDAFACLRENLPERSPRVLLGAEVLICDGMDRMENLPRLCLEGTNELLLELPFYQWSRTIWDTIFQLSEREDVRIVIAHADRYRADDIEQLIREGIPLQLNAACMMHPLRRGRYFSWIDRGYVKYFGSDIHGTQTGYRQWEKCKKILTKRGSG